MWHLSVWVVIKESRCTLFTGQLVGIRQRFDLWWSTHFGISWGIRSNVFWLMWKTVADTKFNALHCPQERTNPISASWPMDNTWKGHWCAVGLCSNVIPFFRSCPNIGILHKFDSLFLLSEMLSNCLSWQSIARNLYASRACRCNIGLRHQLPLSIKDDNWLSHVASQTSAVFMPRLITLWHSNK